jgi:hypothetical protein
MAWGSRSHVDIVVVHRRVGPVLRVPVGVKSVQNSDGLGGCDPLRGVAGEIQSGGVGDEPRPQARLTVVWALGRGACQLRESVSMNGLDACAGG